MHARTPSTPAFVRAPAIRAAGPRRARRLQPAPLRFATTALMPTSPRIPLDGLAQCRGRRSPARRERARARVAAQAGEERQRARDAAAIEAATAQANARDAVATEAAAAQAKARAKVRQARHDDVYAALRGLQASVAEARRGAEVADAMPDDATTAECAKAALAELARPLLKRCERMARCST